MTQESNACISLLHDYRATFSSTQGKGPFPSSQFIKQKCPTCAQEFEKLGKKFTYGNLTKVANCMEKKSKVQVQNLSRPIGFDQPMAKQPTGQSQGQPIEKSTKSSLESHPKIKALTETLKPKAMEKWPLWLIILFYFLLIVFSIVIFVVIVKSADPFYNHRKHLIAESADSYVVPANDSFYKKVQQPTFDQTPAINIEGIPIDAGEFLP